MTIKTNQLEGNGASQLVQVIRAMGRPGPDLSIELGTITAAAPALKLKLDNMKIELDADDVVVSELLTNRVYPAAVSIGPSKYAVTIDGSLKVGDRVIVAGVSNGQTYIILDRVGVI